MEKLTLSSPPALKDELMLHQKITVTWTQGSNTLITIRKTMCDVLNHSPVCFPCQRCALCTCYANTGQAVWIGHISVTCAVHRWSHCPEPEAAECVVHEHVGLRLRGFSFILNLNLKKTNWIHLFQDVWIPCCVFWLMGMFLRFGQRDTSFLMTSSISDPAEKLQDDMSHPRERAELRVSMFIWTQKGWSVCH